MSRGKWKAKKRNIATKTATEIKHRLPVAEIGFTRCPHCAREGKHKENGGAYPNGNKRMTCEFCGRNFIGIISKQNAKI